VFSLLPGQTNLIKQQIETPLGVKLWSSPCRLPEHKRKVVQRELAAMLDMGVIESNNVGCSPYVLVVKKNGSIWFYMDYRRVNDVSHFDAYPMPRSMSSWTDCISLRPWIQPRATGRFLCCQSLSKISSPLRLVCSNLPLPFGLFGATFQRIMNPVLSPQGCLLG